MSRLNSPTLTSLPGEILCPGYDRAKLRPRIVHLGIGAFMRAHLAWYTEPCLAAGEDWGIVGVSLRSAGVRDQLNPQDGLYTLVQRSGEAETCQVMGAILDVLVGPEDPIALVDRLAHPDTAIVSLTVTEKGYCWHPSSGGLDLNHPDIRADLANPTQPHSVPGYLVAALQRRREQGLGGFTALSCDNLPDNGHVLQRVVLAFAREVDVDLARWIEAEVSFPCTMVDRITPATTDEDRAQLENRLGVSDEALVVTEPFSQWVIEDHFVAGRPAWEQTGVQLVEDVRVFENIKLRLLNGSHSLLAYLGCLAGLGTVSEAMSHPAINRLVRRYMTEDAGQTVTAPEGFDLDDYRNQLCARFLNTALKHRTAQIAQDGSLKVPQRWLAPLREQLAVDGPTEVIYLGLAAWIHFLGGRSDQGQALALADPMAEVLTRTLAPLAEDDDAGRVKAILAIDAIFGADLSANTTVATAITRWLTAIRTQGTLAALDLL